MIHFARVLDNSDFQLTGEIKVALIDRTTKYDFQNLANKPENILNYVKTFSDEWTATKCYVSNIFGGGYDYGAFHLPQVNSIGIVSAVRIQSDIPVYVWLGGLNVPVSINDENGEDRNIGEEVTLQNFLVHNGQKIDGIDIPSAQNNKEFSMNGNGVEDGNFTDELLKDSFVIKTKKTENFQDFKDPGKEKKSKRDFRKIPPSTLAIFGNEELSLAYNDIKENKDGLFIDNTTTLKMNEDGFTILYNRDDKEGIVFTQIDINKEGDFTITKKPKKDNDAAITILSTREKLFTQVTDGQKNTSSMELYPKKTIITSTQGNYNSYIEADGPKITINSTGDITLQSENGKINCGPSGLPVLLAPKGASIIDNQVKIGEQSFTISQTLHG